MINWKLERKSIKDLLKFQKNPRSLSKEQFQHLKKSIESFGLIDKPIVNTDNTIIGGHQRIKVLKGKGITEIECWVPDHQLSTQEIQELNIRLNKNSGEWDWDILANEFEIPELLDWGFSPDELVGATQNIEDEDKPKKPKKNDLPVTCPHCGAEL